MREKQAGLRRKLKARSSTAEKGCNKMITVKSRKSILQTVLGVHISP